MQKKRGQVTVFIIIAIIIIAGIVAFFLLRGRLTTGNIPSSIRPAYTSFLSCIEEDTLTGAGILESQAGYIYLPDFEPGSAYMPFSSQLEFMGNAVPYWYYVSGNNIQKEQIPSKSKMEEHLGRYIEEKVKNCDLSLYNDQGFQIVFGEPKASVKINDRDIDVNLEMQITMSKEEDNAVIRNHNLNVKTNLGKVYDSAKKVYDYEQKQLFLENYAIDTLRTYSPVDGVEISCSPIIWSADEVFDNLRNAIELNTLALKTGVATKEENKYFVLDLPVDEEVSFVNSRSWEYSFEVEPNDGSLLIANPIGNQQGLGILGFCYVPYHFVYNVKYPVLVQVADGDDIFQFPLAIVIQGNNPREPLTGAATEEELTQICEYKNNLVSIKVYDENFNPVDAEISFECLGTKCNIGETKNGAINDYIPQCGNGYILARAEGFEDEKYLYSSINPGSINIIMTRIHEVDVDLRVDGNSYNGNAMIFFTSDKGTKTVAYPEQKSVSLSEGEYEISVYIYKEGQINFESTIKEQCVEIPRTGIVGVFGFTKKKCFDVEIPEQIISDVLAGGGKQKHYILESDLVNSIEINAQSFPVPETMEGLQTNQILFEESGLDIYFR
jgi:hypothetical protein